MEEEEGEIKVQIRAMDKGKRRKAGQQGQGSLGPRSWVLKRDSSMRYFV
jgi:hypothetical protein